ncbi:hypothetical protein GJAV_G00088910 [Gymnothorax javanicus]|nr:hypothetical protein GJAV_G00088910 [Gymnothorax javanicus]
MERQPFTSLCRTESYRLELRTRSAFFAEAAARTRKSTKEQLTEEIVKRLPDWLSHHPQNSTCFSLETLPRNHKENIALKLLQKNPKLNEQERNCHDLLNNQYYTLPFL